ncbi:NAD(P)/FAD-dependent oxidoreductase [Streptomyces evansiae]|uniref:NAD(P)/FAD-dependent oxidoreductase n=1 Tax=Streptomyces evansiae TaxID=3075535 RepID=UPI002887191A|nr:FAD-dependent oxidoreductase [Streptomyces sp. DSM 41859]MDT0423860.1 FAD-dependent oxidoreductase [Streptomyces sp. DSM 41859]
MTAARAPRRIVVVGASAAGLTAAETLRREGYDGALTLLGKEPHLPYDRPPLSKQVLAGEWTAARTRLRHPEEVAALGLDLRLGTAATALSPASRTVTLTDGEDIGWDAVLIATGVQPRRLPWCGLPGTHVLRHLEDALALRERLAADRRLVIVGAGFLGSEVASSARALGARVTLVEPAPVPLARVVGHQVGAHIARLHREHGVDLRTGTAVTGVETAAGRLTGVRLSDATTVPADDVLVAIGSEPATDWLTGSGLRLDDGVVCDAYNSAAPGVYAAGDVARWHNPLFGTSMRLEHRTNAAEQAMAAARHLLHPEPARPFAPVPYFWTDQYGIRVQAYGHLRDHEEARVVAGDPADGRFLVAYRKGRTLVGALSFGLPPKTLRPWRAAVAARADWTASTQPP